MGCAASVTADSVAPGATPAVHAHEWDVLSASDSRPLGRRHVAATGSAQADSGRSSPVPPSPASDASDDLNGASATVLVLSDLLGTPAALGGSASNTPRAASLAHSDAVLHRSQHLHSPQHHQHHHHLPNPLTSLSTSSRRSARESPDAAPARRASVGASAGADSIDASSDASSRGPH